VNYLDRSMQVEGIMSLLSRAKLLRTMAYLEWVDVQRLQSRNEERMNRFYQLALEARELERKADQLEHERSLKRLEQLDVWFTSQIGKPAVTGRMSAAAPDCSSTILSDISKSLHTLGGGDPTRSISASEGEKQLRGETSFAPVIDRLPLIGGQNHCLDAALFGGRSMPNPITFTATCAATGAGPGAIIGWLSGTGAVAGLIFGAGAVVLYGAVCLLGYFSSASPAPSWAR
jgi:hypothetical protein